MLNAYRVVQLTTTYDRWTLGESDWYLWKVGKDLQRKEQMDVVTPTSISKNKIKPEGPIQCEQPRGFPPVHTLTIPVPKS